MPTNTEELSNLYSIFDEANNNFLILTDTTPSAIKQEYINGFKLKYNRVPNSEIEFLNYVNFYKASLYDDKSSPGLKNRVKVLEENLTLAQTLEIQTFNDLISFKISNNFPLNFEESERSGLPYYPVESSIIEPSPVSDESSLKENMNTENQVPIVWDRLQNMAVLGETLTATGVEASNHFASSNMRCDGPIIISIKADNAAMCFMGLANSPNISSFDSLPYAWKLQPGTLASIFEYGVNVFNVYVGEDDIFSIQRDIEGNIHYLINGVVSYSSGTNFKNNPVYAAAGSFTTGLQIISAKVDTSIPEVTPVMTVENISPSINTETIAPVVAVENIETDISVIPTESESPWSQDNLATFQYQYAYLNIMRLAEETNCAPEINTVLDFVREAQIPGTPSYAYFGGDFASTIQPAAIKGLTIALLFKKFIGDMSKFSTFFEKMVMVPQGAEYSADVYLGYYTLAWSYSLGLNAYGEAFNNENMDASVEYIGDIFLGIYSTIPFTRLHEMVAQLSRESTSEITEELPTVVSVEASIPVTQVEETIPISLVIPIDTESAPQIMRTDIPVVAKKPDYLLYGLIALAVLVTTQKKTRSV